MGILQIQQQNIAAASAYTEYSFKVPPRVNELTIQLRLNDTLFWYMTPTTGANPGASSNLPQSPAPYNTLPTGASRTVRGLLGGQTIYFQVQTSQAGQVLEIDYYGDN